MQQADISKQADHRAHGSEVAIQARPKRDEFLLYLPNLSCDTEHRQPTNPDIWISRLKAKCTGEHFVRSIKGILDGRCVRTQLPSPSCIYRRKLVRAPLNSAYRNQVIGTQLECLKRLA